MKLKTHPKAQQKAHWPSNEHDKLNN